MTVRRHIFLFVKKNYFTFAKINKKIRKKKNFANFYKVILIKNSRKKKMIKIRKKRQKKDEKKNYKKCTKKKSRCS